MKACDEYLRNEADYFIDVFEERHPPSSPPHWSPDGGRPTHRLMSMDQVSADMSRKAPIEEESISSEELSEVLAEATGATPEEIDRGAEEFEIAPTEEAAIIGYGGHGPLTGSEDSHDNAD
ncbi:hypothetical protein [Halococcus sp. IIIV-5B]|uniref:hypothetical protein n=1 Tax=Halococcus sp. IIIV-5B TaxID=2321230 RepID=UPI0018F53EEE|nr:hypothetical protein [Halococcus sp. IIIV-5B]